jgi:hypothetical protein
MHGFGIVKTLLTDDLKGSRHQKFIIEVSHNKSILIIHNIDISSKVINLKKGDKIEFQGEYQWNSRGGLVHWTHKDPHGMHKNGWLKHKDKVYQ